MQEKGVLEKVLQKDFTGLSEDHLDREEGEENEGASSAIAGVVYAHAAARLVGDNEKEKALKSLLVGQLQEKEADKTKTAAEIQRESDPDTFNQQKAAFMAARRRAVASTPPVIPIVRK